MIKLTRRAKIRIAILISVLAGFPCIAWLPGSIEGVYSPLEISSTMGCDCDQFEEFRDGRVIFHVMDSDRSSMFVYYEKDSSGSIIVRLASDIAGDKGELLARAEPHLLGTMFYYPENGKSEWAWKRFVTKEMKSHMATVKIKDLVYEKDGVRFNTYDSKFNVISSTFKPKAAGSQSKPAVTK